MTSIAAARAELAAAFVAAGLPAGPAAGAIEPPAALIYGDGVDTSAGGAHYARGQVPYRFRAVVLAGVFDDGDVPGDELAGVLGDALAAVQALAGWQIIAVGRDTAWRLAGGVYLGAELTCSRMIDI